MHVIYMAECMHVTYTWCVAFLCLAARIAMNIITIATAANTKKMMTVNTVTRNVLRETVGGAEVKVHCCSSGDSITTAQLSSTLSLSPCTNTALCNTCRPCLQYVHQHAPVQWDREWGQLHTSSVHHMLRQLCNTCELGAGGEEGGREGTVTSLLYEHCQFSVDVC